MSARDKCEVNCSYCNNVFEKEEFRIKESQKLGYKKYYCSRKCGDLDRNRCEIVICNQCSKSFEKSRAQIIKTKNINYCSRSCAAIYNNTHKTQGTRVSKLEVWVQTKLTEKYPTLEVHYNRKDAINSELDIYIPSLKLAFELNGIFHYEPIFGQDKLDQILNNDNRKFQACLEAGIELCIIDTNTMKRFKEQKAYQFLDIVCNIIAIKQ